MKVGYIPEIDELLIAKGLKPFPEFDRFVSAAATTYSMLLQKLIKKYDVIISDRGQLDLTAWYDYDLEEKLKKICCEIIKPDCVICLESYLIYDKNDKRKEYVERIKGLYVELGKRTKELYSQWCGINKIPFYEVKNADTLIAKAQQVKEVIEMHLTNSERKPQIIVITGGSHSGKTEVIRKLKRMIKWHR